MDLNIFKKITNRLGNNDVQNFLQEIKNSMENSHNKKNEIGILEKIQTENKVSIGTKNYMDNQMDCILLDYANETLEKGELYFVIEKLKEDDKYVIYKYENGTDSVLKLSKDVFPENIEVNSAFRMEEDKYVLDIEATLELEKRINEMAKRLIQEQTDALEEYRKEGHLYRVSENINGSVFLWDITDKPKEEIEEIDFPKELLDNATEGKIFEYTAGEYRLKQ